MYQDFVEAWRAWYFGAIALGLALFVAARQIERVGLWRTLRSIHCRTLPFYVYTAFLLFVTVLGRTSIVSPLRSLYDNFWPLTKQEIENILMFVPFSLLGLLGYRPKYAFCAAFLMSLGFSLFIEGSQLVTRLGCFQFSDLLYNTLGGAAGGIVYCVLRALIRLLCLPFRGARKKA